MSFDAYAVLGVLPGADQVVINAAYRALAQRYHPDKWRGDPAFAHEKMSEVNKAFALIGSEDQRKKYDSERSGESTGDFYKNEDGKDQAFRDEFAAHQNEWNLAVEIYPDLEFTRNNLRKISSALDFEYVTVLLATKDFKSRRSLARNIEQKYLERFFGGNAEIVAFAKRLILNGRRDAALKLNQYIAVLGENLDAEKVILRIKEDYLSEEIKQEREKEELKGKFEECRQLYRKLMRYEEPQIAISLALLNDCKILKSDSSSVFSQKCKILSPKGPIYNFSGSELVRWALSEYKEYGLD